MLRGWRRFYSDKPLRDRAFAFVKGIGRGVLIHEEDGWLFKFYRKGKKMKLCAHSLTSLIYLEKMPRKIS